MGEEKAPTFARRCGLTPGRLYSALDKQGTTLGFDALVAICNATGCATDWLLRGEGPMYPGPTTSVGVPTYDTGGGGHWVTSEDATPYDTAIPPGLVGFRVRGDSMEPLARDGQVVFALREAQPATGDLAVIELADDRSMFKRVYFRDHSAILAPVNPAYEPELVKRRDIRRALKVWGVKF